MKRRPLVSSLRSWANSKLTNRNPFSEVLDAIGMNRFQSFR